MEGPKIDRLRFEQQKAIGETRERITLLNKYKDDYKNLKEKFKTLPDNVTHDVMVPFGKLAFMPGQLVHTNEVTVLLGDNWFAERSAKQAASVIDRRIQSIDKQIEDLQKQLGLLTPRLDFTTDMKEMVESRKGVVEINEEYDPVKEKEWKEQHRNNVRLAKQKEAARRAEVGTKEDKTDHLLWQRLEELERQEQERNELNTNWSEDDAAIGTTSSADGIFQSQRSESEFKDTSRKRGKQVQWKDLTSDTCSPDANEDNNSDDYEDDDDDEDDDEDEDGEEDDPEDKSYNLRQPRTIRFHHTPIDPEKPATVTHKSHSFEDPSITSPADLYKVFVDVPKSILKPQRVGPDLENNTMQPDVREKVILPGSKDAFSGEILERAGVDVNLAPFVFPTTDTRGPQTEATKDISDSTGELEREKSESKEMPVKVSKFKARRMQQKR